MPPTAKIDTSVVDSTVAITEVATVSTIAMFSSIESVEYCTRLSSSSAGGQNVPGTKPLNLSEKVISNQLTELAGACLKQCTYRGSYPLLYWCFFLH